MLPSVGNHISRLYLNQPSLLPVLLPPDRTVKAAPVPLPLGCEVGRKPAGHFLYNAGNDYGNGTAGAHKPCNIAQIKVIGSEVMIGVEAHDGIKELVGKGQAMRLGRDRKDLLLPFGGSNALPVVTCTHPQIGGPDLQVEF